MTVPFSRAFGLLLMLVFSSSAAQLHTRPSLAEEQDPSQAHTGSADKVKAEAVRAAMLHSWQAYVSYAWGFDELKPRTKQGQNWLNLGGTIVDAMSTLAIMGEVAEFRRAATWVRQLQLEGRGNVSFFETTIRELGGIMSAYELSCELPGPHVALRGGAVSSAEEATESRASSSWKGPFVGVRARLRGGGSVLETEEVVEGERGQGSADGQSGRDDAKRVGAKEHAGIKTEPGVNLMEGKAISHRATDQRSTTKNHPWGAWLSLFFKGSQKASPPPPSSCDEGLLEVAASLGDRLLRAFETPSGLPYATVNLNLSQRALGLDTTQKYTHTQDSGGNLGMQQGTAGRSDESTLAVLAEVGTHLMEFSALSRHTKNATYQQVATKAIRTLAAAQSKRADGLLPLNIDLISGQFTSERISLGGGGDSTYEYLLKAWVHRGGSDDDELTWLKKMYDRAMKGVMKELVQVSSVSGDVYLADLDNASIVQKFGHLACFAGGTLALGAPYAGVHEERHLEVAKGLGETCHNMYRNNKFGLSPESVDFSSGSMAADTLYNIQRPEAVETFFYLWRATHDPKWREYGWEVFMAFQNNTKIASGGYVGVFDVTQTPLPLDDTQQTFWLAETLKYLFLLFSEDTLIPLDKYVFNTEAHPLRIWKTAPDLAADQTSLQ